MHRDVCFHCCVAAQQCSTLLANPPGLLQISPPSSSFSFPQFSLTSISPCPLFIHHASRQASARSFFCFRLHCTFLHPCNTFLSLIPPLSLFFVSRSLSSRNNQSYYHSQTFHSVFFPPPPLFYHALFLFIFSFYLFPHCVAEWTPVSTIRYFSALVFHFGFSYLCTFVDPARSQISNRESFLKVLNN